MNTNLDQFGVRYLVAGGVRSKSNGRILSTLRASSRLDAKQAGANTGLRSIGSIISPTHPAPIARVQRATHLARKANVKNPINARKHYLSKLNGMLYGDAPDQGFIRGREFLHPKLRFAFRVPQGFSVFNTPQAAHGFGRPAPAYLRRWETYSGSMTSYIRSVWAKKMRLRDLEPITVNGLQAATATTRARISGGNVDLRLVAYRIEKDIYRFTLVTPTERTAAMSRDLRRLTYSRLGVKVAGRA